MKGMGITMKRKMYARILAGIMALSLLTGCQDTSGTKADSTAAGSPSPAADTSAAGDKTEEKGLKVALLINGVLGDQSYYDSAAAGMEAIKENYGCETKIVEMGSDATKYEPTITEYSESGDWDVIILCTNTLKEILQEIAQDYPDQKYILFGARADYENFNMSNVYTVDYLANEGAYLAGVVAAGLTTSDVEGMNEEKVIGFVGGQDVTVINDFLIGFIEGAKSVDSDIKVITSYVGDYVNTGKGKELALTQIQQGADVIFQCAGGAGTGVFEAASEKGVLAIGCDADQYEVLKSMDDPLADVIVTSVMKRVGISIERAVGMAIDGTLPYGSFELVGVKENVTGIAVNDNYKAIVPDAIVTSEEQAEKAIVDGTIKVSTALGMTTEEVSGIRNSVKP
ncbi:BMP family ABC transporter substrate-binding protein [Enterocloster aldenensis]|nr:BMP family ABC transporter substrate-binding protein [Enterocloster aldenensis]